MSLRRVLSAGARVLFWASSCQSEFKFLKEQQIKSGFAIIWKGSGNLLWRACLCISFHLFPFLHSTSRLPSSTSISPSHCTIFCYFQENPNFLSRQLTSKYFSDQYTVCMAMLTALFTTVPWCSGISWDLHWHFLELYQQWSNTRQIVERQDEGCHIHPLLKNKKWDVCMIYII